MHSVGSPNTLHVPTSCPEVQQLLCSGPGSAAPWKTDFELVTSPAPQLLPHYEWG